MIVDALVEIPKGSRNTFNEVADLADLPPHFLAEIRHFFEVYKTLEHKEAEVFGWSGAGAAEQTVREAQDRHRSHVR